MIGVRRAISLFTNRPWTAPVRLGDLRCEVKQALARQVLIEALVGVSQPVDDRLRRALGREQGPARFCEGIWNLEVARRLIARRSVILHHGRPLITPGQCFRHCLRLKGTTEGFCYASCY